MPRIYDSRSEPLDFCQRCFPSEAVAQQRFGMRGDGPDGRGNCFEHDAEHPDYGGESYTCVDCRRALSNRDNHPRPPRKS